MEFVEIPSADESEDSEYENDNDFETSVRDVDESQVDESIDQAHDSPKNGFWGTRKKRLSNFPPSINFTNFQLFR